MILIFDWIIRILAVMIMLASTALVLVALKFFWRLTRDDTKNEENLDHEPLYRILEKGRDN